LRLSEKTETDVELIIMKEMQIIPKIAYRVLGRENQ
jgi:hypothetical protein